jgi:hypothetical protein
LSRFNVTQADLQQGRARVQHVTQLNAAQEKEKAEAQPATKARDAALDALDEWMMEFKQVDEIALVSLPQQFKTLKFSAVA